ncbi:MAG: DUF1385 domain-containing protein [Actinobacteria bacterium]|nr:DUF1385 domain-containing protein [Actinomycetota bacterium]
MAPHYYGGQAIIEGVMMRGADRWAVAVRRPDGGIYLERHAVSDFPERFPAFKKPMLRGVYALGDALTIGMKALGISANQALEDEEQQDLPTGAMGASMAVALLVFVGIFIVLPSAGTKLIGGEGLGDGAWFHLVESLARIAIFLAYLYAISFIADIRRVFQYHGAEHKTIAAWEHGEPLDPDSVNRYSTLHVRCGTNFLIMVMLLALVVYTLVGAVIPAPDTNVIGKIGYHVGLRVVLLPVIAGLAYEGLRLGARYGDNLIIRGLMKPGLWLQLLTTKEPTPDMIEVAIRAFEFVVPNEHLEGRIPPDTLDSKLVMGEDDLAEPLPPDADDLLAPESA